jgi:hypothetical protein
VVDIKGEFIHEQAMDSFNTHSVPNTKTRIFEVNRLHRHPSGCFFISMNNKEMTGQSNASIIRLEEME